MPSTRARYQAKLFTSFLPEEMDSSRSQSEGVKLLKGVHGSAAEKLGQERRKVLNPGEP